MKKFLFYLSAAVLSAGLFSGCEYENPQDFETVLLPHKLQILNQKDTLINGVEIGYNYLTPFDVDSTATEGITEMQFVSVGKGKSLSRIDKVPATGWQTDTLLTAQNYGYLVRYHKYGTEGWLYRRLYIKTFTLLGGEDWYAKIQYDKRDWNPLANQ